MRVQASSGFAFPSPVAYGVWDHSGVGAGYGHVCPRREIEGARRAGGARVMIGKEPDRERGHASKLKNTQIMPKQILFANFTSIRTGYSAVLICADHAKGALLG